MSSSPSSYTTIIAFCSLANFINSADRVIMPIAIVPLAARFGWSLHQQGLILSSFSAGFFTAQLVGAGAAPRLGPKLVLGSAVSLWSVSTFLIPYLVPSLPLIVAARLAMGFGEGFGLPAIFHIYSVTLLPGERSRAFGYLLAFGSAGQCVATLILPHLPWPWMFYGFGIAGLFWVAFWALYYRERRSLPTSSSLSTSGMTSSQPLLQQQVEEGLTSTPGPVSKTGFCCCPTGTSSANGNSRWLMQWLIYFTSWPLWAIYIAHFAMNWSNYTVANWLPTYLTLRLGAGSDHISLTAVPYAVNALAGVGAGHVADRMLTSPRARSILYVRRLATLVGLVVPAICLLLFAACDNVMAAMVVITIGMAASACNSAGHLSNHADVAPRAAGVTFAIANTIGALPGVICGPLTADLVVKSRGRWYPVFAISALVNILAAVIYLGHSSASQVLY